MTITQFVENVHVSRVAVLDAIRSLFPEKEIKHGVAIELDENEVAVLSYHFHHTTSNNSSVNDDAITEKEALLNFADAFVQLCQFSNRKVNLPVLKERILELTSDQSSHLVKALHDTIVSQNTATRFRAAFSISDMFDKIADSHRFLLEED